MLMDMLEKIYDTWWGRVWICHFRFELCFSS